MKLNHVTLVVSDVSKSIEFYSSVLGFESTFSKEISGEQFSTVTAKEDVRLKFAVLRLPDTDVIIELAQLVHPQEKINRDFRHIAFEVDDVDAVYSHLSRNNAELVSEPVTVSECDPKIDGKRFFYFRDPDGNMIEILNKRENRY